MTTVWETLGRSVGTFGTRLGNCHRGSIVWWHVTSTDGVVDNRPLWWPVAKDAADEEELHRAGGG